MIEKSLLIFFCLQAYLIKLLVLTQLLKYIKSWKVVKPFEWSLNAIKTFPLPHFFHKQEQTNNMGFSKTSLPLFLFFILFTVSYATSRIINHARFPSTTFSPNQQAEKLIRSFNLFPKQSVNIIHGDHSLDHFLPGKIVEKKFSFFSDSDGPSIEDLGHHAGYYSLPRSNSSR